MEEKGKKIKLLDIGCGVGNFLDRAAACGISSITGLEATHSIAKFLKKRGKNDTIEG